MVLIVESGRAEVDQADFRVEKDLPMSRTTINSCRRRRHRPVVCEGLVVVVDEEDVLWLQIRVDEVQVVEEGYTCEQLFRELLDVRAREWHEAV